MGYRMVKLFHLLQLVVMPCWKVVITYVPKTRNRTVVNILVLYFTFCSSGYQHQWLFKSKYYAWVWWEMNYRIFSFNFSFERCSTRGWYLFLLGVKVLVMLCIIWLLVCSELCMIVGSVYSVCVICICSICCRFVSLKVIYREF